MANIMQMFRAKNKVSRNAFDLSKKVAFTAKAGELLPIYGRVMMQGDVAEIHTQWKTRTMPLNQAAFTRFREYYDWFFVPLDLLWNRYNTWSTNMLDNNQVASSINGSSRLTDKHPYFTVSQVFEYLVSLGSSENQFGFRRVPLSQKLLHYLGYGDFYGVSTRTYLYNSELSPWRLLAYQKIYQDWYRNTQWEAARPESCNINYIDGSPESLQLPISEIDASKVNMFDLQYANWNKDMFMGVLPNSQYGDASLVQETSNFSYIGNKPPIGNLLVGQTNDTGDLNVICENGVMINDKTQFTILALRRAEALQKFKEIAQSNSQDFPSQSEAHFGYRPSDAYSHRCRRIGGYDGTIEIQDIDNTNITENEDGTMNSADIAGKGLNRGDGGLKQFTADVPGVLMCIYHVVPLLDYATSGIAPDNIKTKFTDYAIPEFDKTGMQQVPLVMLTNNTAEGPASSTDLGDGLLGYAPAYFDYKMDIDDVRGAFYNGGLESWVAPITRSYLKAFFDKGNNNSYKYAGLNANFFKINPAVTDPIFATDNDSAVSSDKFLINCYHNIKMIRPLDVDGLPY